MGYLYDMPNRLYRRTIACFDNGIVYDGPNTHCRIIGHYDDSCIYDARRNTIAKHSNGVAYSLPEILGSKVGDTGTVFCCCKSGTVYNGANQWRGTLGSYEGDAAGACAAAVLYYQLYQEKTTTTHDTDSPTLLRTDSAVFWAAAIALLLALFMVYYLWFTEQGRSSLFLNPIGIVCLCICAVICIVSSIIIRRSNSIFSLKDIMITALRHYLLLLIVYITLIIISSIIDKSPLSETILLIIFSPLFTIGIGAPFYCLQTLIIWLEKKYSF